MYINKILVVADYQWRINHSVLYMVPELWFGCLYNLLTRSCISISRFCVFLEVVPHMDWNLYQMVTTEVHTLTLCSSSCCNISTRKRTEKLVASGPTKSCSKILPLSWSFLFSSVSFLIFKSLSCIITTNVRYGNKLIHFEIFTLGCLSHHFWKQLQNVIQCWN